MVVQATLWLLLTAGALALLHVVLGIARRGLPLVSFLATGAVASAAAGLWVVRETLALQIDREPLIGVPWAVLLGLGFFAAGAVLAGAWIVVARGTGAGLHRLMRRGR